MRVEPAFAAAAIDAAGDTFHRQPGKAPHQRVRSLKHDIRPFGDLGPVIGLQDGQAFLRRQDQIAAFAKTDVGFRPELLLQPAEEA